MLRLGNMGGVTNEKQVRLQSRSLERKKHAKIRKISEIILIFFVFIEKCALMLEKHSKTILTNPEADSKMKIPRNGNV